MTDSSKATTTQRRIIGLMLYGAGDPTCRALWRGVETVAREQDVNLISFRAEPLSIPEAYLDQANVLYELADAARLDGLVIWGGVLAHYVPREEVLRLLERRYAGLPLVNVSSQLPDMPNVIIDNYQGTYDAVAHLLDVHGYRRIAFVRGPEGHVEAEARYRGYREALAEHGVELDPALVAPGDFAEGTGRVALHTLLDERDVSFEAVVTANDQLALDVIAGLRARALDVPRDVAVIGFDNRPEVRFVTPPLTSVDQPWMEMGRQAAELLLRRLAGEEALPAVIKVPPRLLVRQSCGCTPRSVQRLSTPTLPDFAADRAAAAPLELTEAVAERALDAMAAGTVPEERLTPLLAALVADVNAPGSDRFLNRLEEALYVDAERNGEVEGWHDVISAMRQTLSGAFETAQAWAQAETLWQQARVMIGEWAARIQADRRFADAHRRASWSQIGQQLSVSLGIADLLDRITAALTRLEIPRCYLSLYERPAAPATWARLMLAYDHGQRRLSAETRFRSRQLLPSDLLPDERFSLHVEPLYFREHQLGFALFEAEPERGEVYGVLQQDISGALYGSRLLERTEQRAARIQTAAEVAQVASSMLNTGALIERVVELARARFGLYYVGLFLVDDAGEWAELRAGTGEAGQEMVDREHTLRVGGDSMIGQCVANREARVALDVGEEAVRFDNPLLPETRSEMALPLISRGEVIGALTVQSAMVGAFSQEDITVFQTMASQVAAAIENARLLEQTRSALAEMATTQRRYIQQAWEEYLQAPQALSYTLARSEDIVMDEALDAAMEQAVRRAEVVVLDREGSDGADAGQVLVVPALVQGQPIGAVVLKGPARGWTAEEIAMARLLTERMALTAENLRLFEETQRVATRERLVGEVMTQVRERLDVEAVLRTAADQIYEALELEEVTVRLADPDEIVRQE